MLQRYITSLIAWATGTIELTGPGKYHSAEVNSLVQLLYSELR